MSIVVHSFVLFLLGFDLCSSSVTDFIDFWNMSIDLHCFYVFDTCSRTSLEFQYSSLMFIGCHVSLLVLIEFYRHRFSPNFTAWYARMSSGIGQPRSLGLPEYGSAILNMGCTEECWIWFPGRGCVAVDFHGLGQNLKQAWAALGSLGQS